MFSTMLALCLSTTQLPPPRLLPADQVPAPAVVRPIALGEFAASFKPAGGKYEVLFCNPVTGCPTPVCFCLPDGCVKCVRVTRRQITFDYGNCQVSIRFRIITGRPVVLVS
jgi:hypothetical protein